MTVDISPYRLADFDNKKSFKPITKSLSEVEKAVLVLQEAIEHNRKVCNALNTIIRLADISDISKDELNTCGAYELTVRALSYYGGSDSIICAKVIRTIGLLGYRSPSSRKVSLISSNILFQQDRIKFSCETVMAGLNRHPHCEEVAVAACFAIWNMANSFGGACGLGESGACEICVSAMLRNINNEVVVQEACFAIGILASWSLQNKHRLSELGACHAIVSALRKFNHNERVAAIACESISHLANDDTDIQHQLLEVGACEAVLEAVNNHKESHSILWFACHVLKDLYHDHDIIWNNNSNTTQSKSNSSRVISIPTYIDFIKIWQPDTVIREIKWKRRKNWILFWKKCLSKISLQNNETLLNTPDTSNIQLLGNFSEVLSSAKISSIVTSFI